jgi:hypothetical protein
MCAVAWLAAPSTALGASCATTGTSREKASVGSGTQAVLTPVRGGQYEMLSRTACARSAHMHAVRGGAGGARACGARGGGIRGVESPSPGSALK